MHLIFSWSMSQILKWWRWEDQVLHRTMVLSNGAHVFFYEVVKILFIPCIQSTFCIYCFNCYILCLHFIPLRYHSVIRRFFVLFFNIKDVLHQFYSLCTRTLTDIRETEWINGGDYSTTTTTSAWNHSDIFYNMAWFTRLSTLLSQRTSKTNIGGLWGMWYERGGYLCIVIYL